MHASRYRARGVGRIDQQLGELAGQERVPSGALMHVPGPAVSCSAAADGGDEIEHLARG
jgi:hypothetical protein